MDHVDKSTGEWRIRKNKEHQELYQRPSIKKILPIIRIIGKNSTGECTTRKTTTWKTETKRGR